MMKGIGYSPMHRGRGCIRDSDAEDLKPMWRIVGQTDSQLFGIVGKCTMTFWQLSERTAHGGRVAEMTAEKDRLQAELNQGIEQEQSRQSGAETDGGGHTDVGGVAVACECQGVAEQQRDEARGRVEAMPGDLRAAQGEIRALRVRLRTGSTTGREKRKD
jgi:hypothetical protein